MDHDKKKFTKEVRVYAQKYFSWLNMGADLVGFVSVEEINKIKPYWVDFNKANTQQPEDTLPEAKSVIVLGHHAWDDMVEALSRKGDKLESFGYERMYYEAELLMNFLREKGCKAELADGLPMKQVARLAGFGSYGKNSLNINPKYGPWVRILAMVTDAEFDYSEEFTEDLCKDCDLCVRACPTGALTPYVIDHKLCINSLHDDEWLGIFKGEKTFEDYRDVENGNFIFEIHAPKLTENTYLLCTTCQKACPYGREERGLLPKKGRKIIE